MQQPPSPAGHGPILALYQDHHAWLVQWLCKRLRHADNAADLAQDTFMHLFGHADTAATLRQPRAWLSTVAKGLMVDRARRQRVERAYLDALALLPEAVAPSPEAQLVLLQTLLAVDALLSGLAPKVRSAFLWSRLDGLGYQAIAERLGVSLSSVEKYMATAIRHCYQARA